MRKRAEEELKNTLAETRVREWVPRKPAVGHLRSRNRWRSGGPWSCAWRPRRRTNGGRLPASFMTRWASTSPHSPLELKLLRGLFPADSAAVGRAGRLRGGHEPFRIATELCPPSLDDHGLAKTLQNYLEDWSRHTNILVDFHNSGFDKGRAPLPRRDGMVVGQEDTELGLRHHLDPPGPGRAGAG